MRRSRKDYRITSFLTKKKHVTKLFLYSIFFVIFLYIWLLNIFGPSLNNKLVFSQYQYQYGCRSDQDCKCYEICIVATGQCFDFRGLMKGCNYYDNCAGDRNCCSNNQCNSEYCVNADEEICEDSSALCHGYFSSCGVPT